MNEITPRFFDIDLVMILTGVLLMGSGSAGAAAFAFGQGLLIDVFSAGFLGLFALLYTISFVCLEIGSRFFDLRSAQGQVILVGLAVLFKELFLVGLLDLFGFRLALSAGLFGWFGASALATGLIAPLGFCMVHYLQMKTAGEVMDSE